MSRILKQLPRVYGPLKFHAEIKPLEAKYRRYPTGQATIALSDGSEEPTSCIRCVDPPCIRRPRIAPSSEFGSLFPADQNNLVCPVDAIHWPIDEPLPEINSQKCIACGICISACPVSAIYFAEDDTLRVAETQAEYLVDLEEPSDVGIAQISKTGQAHDEVTALLATVYEKIERNSRFGGANFPNILTRNLLGELGVNAMTRRQGDTNIRMDMLLDSTSSVGVAEIEFGIDALNSPRNLLDNIAVLSARYGLNKENLVPVVFTLSLPNLRSEYWQVLKDISNVLGIRIATVSVGALLIILAMNKKIHVEDLSTFYVDSEQQSLRQAVEAIVGFDVNVPEGLLGVLEPQK